MTDAQVAAAARALWAEFNYLLPAPPDVVARIALEAAGWTQARIGLLDAVEEQERRNLALWTALKASRSNACSTPCHCRGHRDAADGPTGADGCTEMAPTAQAATEAHTAPGGESEHPFEGER